MILFYIFISTLLVSFISFLGIITFFLKEKILEKILLILVSLSAGVLIGSAFFHLLPEAITEIGLERISIIFLFLIFGFCIFFILEQFIRWHHHHAATHPEVMPFSYLILLSDSIHNFIDGLIIAASFIVSLPVGLVTTLAVALHEIPQEIGDFGVLVYGGFKRNKALLLNFLSAALAILGGLAGFFLSEKIGQSIIFLLPFAAGNFIYLACSDLIPEIKKQAGFKKSLFHFFIFLMGIGLMILIKKFGE